MSPFEKLALTCGFIAAAFAVELIARRRWRRALRRLAAEWKMNFGAVDTLKLTERVARHFPVPGAARLHVTNVIYGADKSDPERYRYVFTAEFTLGVVRTKRRLVRVGSFAEPKARDRAAGRAHHATAPVVLAPGNLSLLAQYRHLAPPASEESGRDEKATNPTATT
jgi:hypothetical protein